MDKTLQEKYMTHGLLTYFACSVRDKHQAVPVMEGIATVPGSEVSVDIG